MTITAQIVQINATVTTAPTPSQLQQSGAIVSVGGSTLADNAYLYCGTLAEVEAILGSGGNHTELLAMATTFFAQGSKVGLYVLELGPETVVTDGITALGNWITANPGIFYAYLVPALWDNPGQTGPSSMNALAQQYASATGKTYFFVTTANSIAAYAGTKSVFVTVPNPSAPSTEFQSAVAFYQWLSNNPSAVAPAPPMAYRFAYGVTPWTQTNNASAINAVLTAYGNVILKGSEGNISTACLFKGTTMDGNQAMFWWAVDWMQIQSKILLAAAIINASNSINPIYYNQNGINRLKAILEGIGNTGISFGLLLSAEFNAVPFATYTAQNPSAYAAGSYAGFSAMITPQLGFLTITFDIEATQFVA